ncbi:short chain enoyl-CoA hydratase [Caballeronia hypogeia]|uniref:Short chain enoyl-CoA hydratase n=1 Tax=Caballeronia hypogeia TaxID=1777140 RepID=A0A158DRN1_9BURK|nr:enoyl-CoA hydratase-related protein [Caballeronia hypogeia]SAK97248.1 short chain enoyl-CoA hydratase [Caballeronia hypogeia]
MSTQDVLYQVDGPLATITLNRTGRHNALTLSMLDAIARALGRIEEDDEVRVLVFRSAGARFFSSGADIDEWSALDPVKMGTRFIRAGNRVFRALEELDIPTVAVLKGHALGGGLELALACDLRYATPEARLGFPEAQVGAIPGWMGCARLTRLIGGSRVREMILLGEPIGAARALEWGLVNDVIPPERIDAHVATVCDLLARRSATSLSVAKRLIGCIEAGRWESAHELAASVCKASPDAAEGVAAFREKRAANFGLHRDE